MTTLLSIGVLAVMAAGMAALTAVTVRWAAFAQTPLRAGTIQFILLMMAGMFTGVLVYFAIGGPTGLVGGFWAAAAIMSASVSIIFAAFLREARPREPPSGLRSSISRAWLVTSVVGLVLLNEFLMGWSFSLLSGGLGPSLGPSVSSGLRVLSAAITSPWFVFPMALEMVLTLQWLLARLPLPMRRFLWIQPLVMVCSPPTFDFLAWEASTAVAASALMALAVALYLAAVFEDQPLSPAVTRYALRLILSLGAMSLGLYLWVEFGSPEVFALSLLAQMVVFLQASTDPDRFSGVEAPTRGPGTDGVTVGGPRAPERAPTSPSLESGYLRDL